MKIIKIGMRAEADKNWWVGKVLTCPRCLTEFEIEPKDFVSHLNRESGQCVTLGAITHCPSCGKPIEFHP